MLYDEVPIALHKVNNYYNIYKKVCIGPPMLARRALWKKFCLSFCPSVQALFWNWFISLLVSFKLWEGAVYMYVVVRDRARF